MMLTPSLLHQRVIAREPKILQQPLQLAVGFFLAFRVAITYLGFQSNPRAGSVVNLSCMVLLFAAAGLYTLGDGCAALKDQFSSRPLRWLFVYLAMSGMSLLWSGTESVVDAGGLWIGMALEVAIVVLVVRAPQTLESADAVLKGFVLGMFVVSAVAWLSPTLDDLRIGDYEFLHPNMIGLNCALGFFLAQHLTSRQPAWRWAGLALAATMLRSLSKTSIIAFVIAEAVYLMRARGMSRATKLKAAATACAVLLAFSALFEAYLEIYTTNGTNNQTETLTGRTAIWATAFSTAMEQPWLGHGFYSFRAIAPSIGTLQPWHAHNELLQEFFEYGLVGVLVTTGIYLSLTFAARKLRSASRSAGRPDPTYAALVLVIVPFSLIHGLTESINFGLTIPLWLVATLALGLMAEPEVAEC